MEQDEREFQDDDATTATSTNKLKDLPNLQIDTSVNLQNSVAYAYLDRLNIEQCLTPEEQNSASPLIPASLERAFLKPDGGQQFIVRREKERARFEAERIRKLCEQPQNEIVNPTPVNVSNIPWMGNMMMESPISSHSRSTPSPFAFPPSMNSRQAYWRRNGNKQTRHLQNIDINSFPIASHNTRAFISAPQYIDREVLASIEPDYVNGRQYLRRAGHPTFTFQQPEPVHDNTLNCAVIIEGIHPHTKHCDVFDMLHTGAVCSLKLKPPQPPKHMTSTYIIFITSIIPQRNSNVNES